VTSIWKRNPTFWRPSLLPPLRESKRFLDDGDRAGLREGLLFQTNAVGIKRCYITFGHHG
jgi:hypothetical protein